MHDGFRMHQNINLFIGNAEQPMSFRDFKALVHHGCGVNRDLCAHRPVGMGKRFFDRYRSQFFPCAVAEASAACGYDQAFDLAHPVALQALEDSTVLTVDRNQGSAMKCKCPCDQFTAAYERFLVCERHIMVGFNRRKCRRKTRKSDKCIYKHVIITFRNRLQTLIPKEDRFIRIFFAEFQGIRFIHDRAERNVRKLLQKCPGGFNPASDAETDQFKQIGMLENHIQSLGANTAAGSKQCDTLHNTIPQ